MTTIDFFSLFNNQMSMDTNKIYLNKIKIMKIEQISKIKIISD